MRLKDTIKSEVGQSASNLQDLALGTILEYNPDKEVLTLSLVRNGSLRLYHNIPYPTGQKPKVNGMCAVGFISSSKSLPVVLTLYSESIIYTVSQEEKIPASGPLFIESLY